MNTKLVRVAIGAFIFLVFLKWINVVKAMEYLSTINVRIFFLACSAIVLVQVFRALRFLEMTRILNIEVTFKRSVVVHFAIAMVAFLTPLRVGEGGKVFLFKKNRKDLGFSFIIEKMSDAAILGTCSLASLFFFRKYYLGNFANLFILIFALTILGAVLLANIERIINFIFKTNLKEKWFRDLFSVVIRDRRIFLFFLTSLFIWGLIFLSSYMFLYSIGVTMNFFIFILVMSVSILAGLASGVPGGIGMREFTYTFLLTNYLGVDKTLIGISALINTFGGYLTYSAISIPATIYLKKHPE